MRCTRRAATLVAMATLLGGAALALPPSYERETLVEAIDTWDAGCSGSPRGPTWADMAKAWRLGMWIGDSILDPNDGWQAGPVRVNGNLVDSDFTDLNKVLWGRDHTLDRTDDADATMVTTHGGNAGSDGRWVGIMRVDESGAGDCGSCQIDMDFGDLDLEFLHLSSCFSMDAEDWHPNWSSSFRGVHQILGFHGIMYIRGSLIEPYYEMARDGFDTAIGWAWIDNLYDRRDDDNGNPKDQCPVVRGAGYGESDAYYRLVNERYDNVFTDPVNPSYHIVWYLEGCDPSGKEPL